MNSKKNILFITNLHLWSLEKGKGGRAFISTVEGYKAAGWNIWFVSTGGGVPQNLIEENKLFERSYPKLDKWWKSKSKLLSVFSRYLKLVLINRFFVKSGSKILCNSKSENFVIYAYEVHGVRAAKKLSRRFSVPFVTRFQGTVHNQTPDTFLDRIKKEPHLSALKTSADITIMTNDGTQGLRTLNRFGNNSKKVFFWRNGVDRISDEVISKRDLFRKELHFDDQFTFLTVSRLVNWKKVDRAIRGFYEVQKKYPNSRLLIIGDGVERNNLIQLTKDLNFSEKVHFVGSIEQREVSKYMISSDSFLSFYDLSNVGNPLLEAMMCGKPIITLNVGDTIELIHDGINGILLDMDEINKIPEMMYKVIVEKDFSDKIAAGALETAHKEFWNWDQRITAEIDQVERLF